MKQILILISITFSLSAFSQLKSKIAADYFGRKEYSLCVKMYDELAQKSMNKKSTLDLDWENVRRAAICHFQLFEMNESEKYFVSLKSSNRLSEEDRELYIQTLRYLGKYDESISLINESLNLFPSNSYFKRLSSELTNFKKLFEDSSLYKIKDLSINSGLGDFAPNFTKNGITFATQSVNTKAIQTAYGWDNKYYINILEANYINDTTLGSPRLLKNQFLSKAHDGPVSFNSSGNMMAITKNTLVKKKGVDVVNLSIYFSNLVNGTWSDLTPFVYNNDQYNVGHAVFAENDKALYFVSDKSGGFGETDIYVSRLNKDGNWSEPINLGPTINTDQNEMFPFVQGNNLFFASNGHFGIGGLDIFEQALQSGEKPKNLGFPINSSSDDFGYITDSTELKGYLSSNRLENIDRIYSFKKQPIRVNLIGRVYAIYKEEEPIPNQIVYITRLNDLKTDSAFTNEFGQFTSPIRLNENYKISTEKLDFILLKEELFSTNNIKKDSIFYCQLGLKPTTIQVHLRVIEDKTGKVIPMATTSVTDYSINKDTSMVTNELGTVTLKVERNKSYWAHASKKGYIDDDIAFNSANENDKVIDLELRLPPIVKGEKFKLENIFYDLNKSSLRPESKMALDKLADFLIKNDLKIELSAHTDSRGSDAYNLKLSQARSQSCVDYLITKGVKSNKIIAKGYGETKLLNRCKNNVQCSEEMHQENRRTEVKIL